LLPSGIIYHIAAAWGVEDSVGFVRTSPDESHVCVRFQTVPRMICCRRTGHKRKLADLARAIRDVLDWGISARDSILDGDNHEPPKAAKMTIISRKT